MSLKEDLKQFSYEYVWKFYHYLVGKGRGPCRPNQKFIFLDATRGDHTKWSKSERERQIPYDITYMWNLKYDTNEPIYEAETESQT